MIKIRLYGESIYFHLLEINKDFKTHENYRKIANKMGMPLEEAILCEDFFSLNNSQLRTIGVLKFEDLISDSIGGLLHNSKSKIEIKRGRKLLAKLELHELFQPMTLFPIYNVIKKVLKIHFENQFFLIEKETGLVGEYHINSEDFDIEKLRFYVCKTHYSGIQFEFLYELTYDSIRLKKMNSDTVLTYQYCHNLLNLK